MLVPFLVPQICSVSYYDLKNFRDRYYYGSLAELIVRCPDYPIMSFIAWDEPLFDSGGTDYIDEGLSNITFEYLLGFVDLQNLPNLVSTGVLQGGLNPSYMDSDYYPFTHSAFRLLEQNFIKNLSHGCFPYRKDIHDINLYNAFIRTILDYIGEYNATIPS